MQVVIVSNPDPIPNESTIINELFKEGLSVLHLRRPNETVNELSKLIEEIDEQHHHKIVLHQYFELTEKFKIRGFHLSEKNRLLCTNGKLIEFKLKGLILSSSVHSIKELHGLVPLFDYTFIGPVFDSISKPNYKPNFDVIGEVDKIMRRNVAIFGIGGVDHSKLEQMKCFNGVGLLGSIWNNPENAIEEFKKCKSIADTY